MLPHHHDYVVYVHAPGSLQPMFTRRLSISLDGLVHLSDGTMVPLTSVAYIKPADTSDHEPESNGNAE